MTEYPTATPEFDRDAEMGRLRELNRLNADTLAVLAGRDAVIPPWEFAARRFELFLDLFVGPVDQSDDRLKFEVTWQEYLRTDMLPRALNETAGKPERSIIVPKGAARGNGLHLP